MATNWDTETAKDCKMKDYLPKACEKCRDRLFCSKHRQISIEDWLEETKDEWKRIPDDAKLIIPGRKVEGFNMIHVVTEQKLQTEPDLILEGKVNGVPALIGFKEWVSGDGCRYKEWQPLQYKEVKS